MDGIGRRGALRRGTLAGIVGVTGGVSAWHLGGRRDSPRPVNVLAAGGLLHTLKHGLASVVDTPLEIEAHGSRTVARLVAQGWRDPDIVALADTRLFDDLPAPDWHVTFAGNALVLVYNPHTEGGRRIDAAAEDAWFEPILEGAVRLGRTDPGVDPLGYRTLMAADLASRYYGRPALRGAIVDHGQIYPETAVLSRLETGTIDAAFLYRNMAVERDFASRELPDAVDLSDPAFDERYANATYRLPTGEVIVGSAIRFGATLRTDTARTRRVFRRLVDGAYLDEYGLLTRDSMPQLHGAPPESIADTLERNVDDDPVDTPA